MLISEGRDTGHTLGARVHTDDATLGPELYRFRKMEGRRGEKKGWLGKAN